MKSIKKWLTIVACSLLSLSIVDTLDAKGSGFSSSSRSFSSPSSSSRSTPSSSSSKSSTPSKSYSSSSSSSSSKPNTYTAQTSSRPVSKVETAKYKAAVQSGKAFTTREDAVKDFKATKASSYTSKFPSEPAKRPDYIPSNYTTGGHTYNITYNPSYGGYGYWNGGGPGLGTFLLYDIMSDSLMMNRMMERDHYYIGEAPPTYSAMVTFWVVIGVTVVIVGSAVFIMWLNERES